MLLVINATKTRWKPGQVSWYTIVIMLDGQPRNRFITGKGKILFSSLHHPDQLWDQNALKAAFQWHAA
jgi:hypothetical protein